MPPHQIILIRHAEKGDERVHLSRQGRIRAQELINYFVRDHHPDRCNHISIIIAQKQHRRHTSNRSMETILPLALRLGIDPVIRYTKKHLHRLFRYLMSEACDAKTVLLCMEHEALVSVANMCGLNVRTWALNPMQHHHAEYEVTWLLSRKLDRYDLNVFRQFSITDAGEIFYQQSPDISIFSAKGKFEVSIEYLQGGR